MISKIGAWLKDIVFNRRFALGMALCWGIYMLGAMVWWMDDSLLYIFGAAELFNSFVFVFPICAVIPYALRFSENRKSHLDYMILQRCSAWQYINQTFIRTAISGFLVMAAGRSLFLLTMPCFFPNALLSYEIENSSIIMPYLDGIARQGNWIGYFSYYILSASIPGVFFSVLALTVSAWIDSVYAIFIAPILFLYAMDYAAERIGVYSLTGLMASWYFYDSWIQGLCCSVFTFGLLSVICYAVFTIKGRRYCCGA